VTTDGPAPAERRIKPKYLMERQGKTVALYAGLLDAAHERGLKSITTKLLQAPTEQNGQIAICQATVVMEEHGPEGMVTRTFSGIGDADPSNVTRMLVNAIVRMSETRAKARALRDALNVAELVAAEEFGEDGHGGDLGPASPPARTMNAPTRPAPRPRSVEPPQDDGGPMARDEEEPGDAAPRPVAQAPRTYGPRGDANPGQEGGLPATPRQIETIQRMARAAGTAVETAGLNRAKASATITELIAKMGAQRG
jgi:hypothetical protein